MEEEGDVIRLFLSFLKGLTSLRKIETSMLDFEGARSMQPHLKLTWSMWDDIDRSANEETRC